MATASAASKTLSAIIGRFAGSYRANQEPRIKSQEPRAKTGSIFKNSCTCYLFILVPGSWFLTLDSAFLVLGS
jgi:hypothetical protein